MSSRTLRSLLFIACALTVRPALAETPAAILAGLEQEAKSTPNHQGFSAARGASFFKSTHANDWSCATCHTDNPTATGKHARTGKVIRALAPAANAQRFTDTAKVEKWFKRNCNDVLDRACTAQEKGDVLAYLMSLK